MDKTILEYLRVSDSYVSGEELSHKLKITRSAVWKTIHNLINDGYEIIAVPHLGYKLTKLTHKLLPQEISNNLGTKFIGKHILYFETLSSTMDEAMELGLKDALHGTLVVSETQTKGRGRLGRHWISPKFKGVYFSLILRPQIIPAQASVLTIVIAVALLEAIQNISGLSPAIKWPNDIMLNNKKIGGILLEMNAEADAVKFVVIGVGVNVSSSRGTIAPNSTSLEDESAIKIQRVALLQEILRRIEYNYLEFSQQGVKRILEKWRKSSSTLHSRIKVNCRQEHIEGEAVDIDVDGGLLVRNDSGLIEKVMAGDVVSLSRL